MSSKLINFGVSRLTINGIIICALFLLIGWLIVLPVAGVAWGAFWSVSPGQSGGSLTLNNVLTAISAHDFRIALINTILLAGTVSLIATPLGMAIAWLVVRSNLPHRGLFGFLMLVPIFISPLLGVLAWIALASPRSGVLNVFWFAISGTRQPLLDIYSFGGMVAVMVFHYVSYAYLYGVATFSSGEGSLDEAARVAGSSRWQTLRRITIPLAMPSILASGLMIFVLAAEQFPVPGLLGRPARFETLPSLIYFWLEYTPTNPQAATVAGVTLALISVLGLVLYRKFTRRAERFKTLGGKGTRAMPLVILSRRARIISVSLIVLFLVFSIVIPLTAIVVGSFMRFMTSSISLMQFTTENYDNVFRNGEFVDALWNTLLISASASIGMTLIGLVAGFAIANRTRGAVWIDYICSLPVAIPGLTLAIGLLWVYSYLPVGLYGTIGLLMLAHSARFLPHAVRITSTGMIRIGRDLDEAARIAGAGLISRIFKIYAPLIKDSLWAAAIMILIYSIIEISSTIVLFSRNSTTISVFIWQGMQMTGTVQAFAAATLQCIFILVLLLPLAKRLRPDTIG